jgi:leader peptidase (prepilin peptidase)/N-methyltransferase
VVDVMLDRTQLAAAKDMSWYLAAFVVAIGAAVVSLLLAPGGNGILGAGLAGLMVLIASVDASSYIIPDALTVAGLALALLHAASQNGDAIAVAAAAAALRGAVLAFLFWSLRVAYRWLRGRDGLGLGDVKLAAVAGAWLSWPAIPVAVDIAAFSGIAIYVVRQYALQRPVRATARLPFGAFFAPAIWLGWLFETVMLGKI